ncbi:MAG: STAS domain-containing protein [Spirochaetes bacterium]|jgi:anti-sigma B factor antagonist|nr:STAS domain-containing protein [Spirochaetota bacterium]
MLVIDHRETEPDGAMVVAPRGPLGSETAPTLGSAIDTLAREKSAFIILDAAGLEYASSAGIGMILHAHRSLAADGGALVVCNLPEETRALFRLIGFDRVLDIAGSAEEAERIIAERMAGKPPASPPPPESRTEGPRAEPLERTEKSATEEATAAPETAAEDGFDRALVVECAECGGLVRVRRSGTYQCPHCRTEFSVEKDQTIIF